jgi:geranylgeranyl diphosphate synthase type II
MTFKERQNQYIEAFDQSLAEWREHQIGDIPERLLSAMCYSLFAGGKRVRPVLLLATVDMLEGDLDEAMEFAMALEMIHTYSLIHDDLPAMDDDDLRRGRPTNHKQFDEATAILAGDALLSEAAAIMLRACRKSENKMAAIQAMEEIMEGAGARGMIAGQMEDLMASEKAGDEKLLERIQSLKTACLLTAPLVSGGILAGAPLGSLVSLREYGQCLGVCFQMVDDILDVVGSAEEMGKNPASDAKKEKLTYPALIGLEETHRRVEQWTNWGVEALQGFGEKGWFLRDMILTLAARTK